MSVIKSIIGLVNGVFGVTAATDTASGASAILATTDAGKVPLLSPDGALSTSLLGWEYETVSAAGGGGATINWTQSRAWQVALSGVGLVDLDIKSNPPACPGVLQLAVVQPATGGPCVIQFTGSGAALNNTPGGVCSSVASASTLYTFWYDGTALTVLTFSSSDGSVGYGLLGAAGYMGADGRSYPLPVGATGPIGPNFPITIDLCAAPQSTAQGSGIKLITGIAYFDPTDTRWGLSGSSTAQLTVTVATTNSINTAAVDLLQMTGTGSPTVVATLTPTNSTTPTVLTANVSSAFVNTAHGGNFALRAWVGTPNTNDETTVYSGRLEIKP